jgi:ribose 5-phosphate isomerase A
MDASVEKQRAAERAVALVEDGMRLGLGTGSTAERFVRLLGERVARGLSVHGVPTSRATAALATSLGIPLIELDGELDLCVDGADEIDPQLRLIKGAGGALLHEKIVAAAARRVVIIADSQKRVAVLGRARLPVEVVRFGWPATGRRVAALGGAPELRRGADGQPFVTDEGNFILDCRFGEMARPEELAARIDAIPGVVEHGLFLGLAHLALLGADGEISL